MPVYIVVIKADKKSVWGPARQFNESLTNEVAVVIVEETQSVTESEGKAEEDVI